MYHNTGAPSFPVKTYSAFEEQDSYYNPVKSMSVSAMGGNDPNKSLNINRYATKKTIAQGMMDIALLTANASQLRYVLSLGESHEFYKIMLGLIITSLVLQVLVGILFLVIGAIDINISENHPSANILNDFIVTLIFVITVINIVINGFGIEQYKRVPPGVKIVN